jgi:hypothetical protein
MNCVDDDGRNNWWKLWGTLLTRALKGDTKAARLLLDYALGAPHQTIDLEHREHIDSIPSITPEMGTREAMDIYLRTIKSVGRPGDGGHLDASLGEPPPLMPVVDVEAAMENWQRIAYGDDDDGETTKSVSIPRLRVAQKKG